MKYPVLTRILSAVLALMCLAMIINGAISFKTAESDKNSKIRKYEVLDEKIDTYGRLEKENKGKVPYSSLKLDYDTSKKEYNKQAKEHQEKVAGHTAANSGLKSGADKLWEIKAKIPNMKDRYIIAQAKLSELEANSGQLAQELSKLSSLADKCYRTAAILSNPPADPGSPPVYPGDPPGEGVEDPEYEARLEAYNKACEEYQSRVDAYNEYQTAKDDVASIRAAVSAVAPDAVLPEGNDAEMLYAAAKLLAGIAESDFARKVIVDAAIAEMKTAMEDLKESIGDSDNKLQGQLELIWYKMGQLDDEEADMEKEKEYLQYKSEMLEGERKRLEAQETLERKLNSAKFTLLEYDEIEEKTKHSMGLLAAAEEYSQELKTQCAENYRVRIAIAVLQCAGGLLGFLCIPAAFEKTKSRILLIVPAALAFILAAVGEGLSLGFGMGQLYSSLPVILVSVVYLIFAIPRKKYKAVYEI